MSISMLPQIKATFDRIHLFLTLPEVVRVLNLCCDLRNDTVLAGIILDTNEHTRHFYQFSPFDWFQLILWFCVDNGEWQACNPATDHDEDIMSASDDGCVDSTIGLTVDTRSAEDYGSNCSSANCQTRRRPNCPWDSGILSTTLCQRTQLLSVTCLVEHHIMPWSFRPITVAQELHAIRPVVIPVSQPQDNACLCGNATCRQWSGAQLRQRLDELRDGMGAEMLQGSAKRTQMGVHWDNIVVNNESGEAECRCCAAIEPTVQGFRDTVALLYRRWLTTTATGCRQRWLTMGCDCDEMDEMLSLLRDELIPQESFFCEEVARRRDEVVMEHVCTHSDQSALFDMGHAGRGAQREGFWRIVFHPTMQQVCREVLRPMKVFMSRELYKVMRASANWISDEAFEDDWESFCSSDLVVGLTASGFLAGFFYMVRKPEMRA